MLQHPLFYFDVGADLGTCCDALKGQRAEQLQTPPAAWKPGVAKRLRTQMVGTAHGKSAHFIRKTAAAEWPVIKAIIESSVIFKSLWQWCRLIAMHSLFTSHFLPFISNKKSDFERKIMVFFSPRLHLHSKRGQLSLNLRLREGRIPSWS